MNRTSEQRPFPTWRRPALLAAILLVVLALGLGCGASPGKPLALGASAALPSSPRSHVVIIVMENADYGEVIGSSAAPYLNALARRYALATQSFAITHPSLPNYLALTSGSTHGVSSDCTDCHVSATNIVDQLEAAGISWAAYLEDVPKPCFRRRRRRRIRQEAQPLHLLRRHRRIRIPLRPARRLRATSSSLAVGTPSDVRLDHAQPLRRRPRLRCSGERPLPRPDGAGTPA
jgi:hypothetical protein